MASTSQGSSKILITAAIFCVCVTIALAGAAAWQSSVHSSKLDQASEHESSATLFQEAEAEGQAAGLLLQQYVASGDAALIQQINDHTSGGVTKLTAAVQQSGAGATFLDGGTTLVQAEGQIIALRQAGDVQGATAALTQLSEQFNSFLEAQNRVIATEQGSAESARNDASQASTNASWMIVGAALFGMVAVTSGVLLVRRSASRRRSLDALPSA